MSIIRVNGVTSVPRRDIERETNGPSPVTVRKWTPEEEAKYSALPKPTEGKPGIKSLSEEHLSRGVLDSDEQRRRANIRYERKREEMAAATKEGPDCGLTRLEFIKAIAQGENVASVEKAWEMKYNTLSYWVKRWELSGLTTDKARGMLAASMEESGLKVAPVDSEKVLKELRDRITDYENELARWAQIDAEISLQLDELQEERNGWKARSEELTEAMQGAAVVATQAGARIKELEEKLATEQADKALLLQTIEQAATPTEPAEPHDPVNHPRHYTLGGVECIDGIESALAGLQGAEAYHTGQAIKYIWRWKHKGGVEDLEKAQWYLERLMKRMEVAE